MPIGGRPGWLLTPTSAEEEHLIAVGIAQVYAELRATKGSGPAPRRNRAPNLQPVFVLLTTVIVCDAKGWH
jgi:hypothetical protein